MLLVVDSLDAGGAERHVVDLARALTQRGHTVAVACSVGGRLAAPLAAAGVPVHELVGTLVKRRHSPRYAAALAALLRRSPVDLVHAHIHASAAAAAVACAATATPLVVTEHTEAPWRRGPDRAVGRFTYRRSARLVAVSSAIAAMLVSSYDVAPDRVRVVRPCVVPCPPVAGDRPRGVVGFVGRLVPSKGLDVLVAALPPGARLVVVGDGPARALLSAAAGPAVTFLGWRDDARALLSSFSVLAVPSLTDGTPLVVSEALAAGVPVVGSAVGGIPDLVTSGVEGLLVPPGSVPLLRAALSRVLSDPALAGSLGAAGLRRAASSSYDAMVSELLDVYAEALASPAAASELPRLVWEGAGRPPQPGA